MDRALKYAIYRGGAIALAVLLWGAMAAAQPSTFEARPASPASSYSPIRPGTQTVVAPAAAGLPSPLGAPHLIRRIPPVSAFEAARATPAGDDAAHARPSLWLLSTRGLVSNEVAAAPAAFTPDVWYFEASSGWVRSSLGALLRAGDETNVTNIFVHGNSTDAQVAATEGATLYEQLRAGGSPASAGQLVIWSWPSNRPGARLRESAQLNARRTDVEGYYLAEFLSQLRPNAPVNLSGYCSGARIVTGGLHVHGGGSLAGLRRELPAAARPRTVRAVLIAAGLDNDWLLPGRPHELALSQVERLVITVNSTDPVLRWYPLMWDGGGVAALGRTGLPRLADLGGERAKIVQLDLTPVMHREHSWKYFRNSPFVTALLRRELSTESPPLVR